MGDDPVPWDSVDDNFPVWASVDIITCTFKGYYVGAWISFGFREGENLRIRRHFVSGSIGRGLKTYLRGLSWGASNYDIAIVKDNGIFTDILDSVIAGIEIASRHDGNDTSVGPERISDSTDRPFISKVGASMSEWNT